MERIFYDFLNAQYEEGVRLAGSTDLMDLQPLDVQPTRRYLVQFRCTGLALENDEVVERTSWLVHVNFHDDYLRTLRPAQLISLITPPFHPNTMAGFACLGRIRPGVSLVELCYQLYGILSYQEFTPREDDALNIRACRWCRAHLDRFPIDPRPLVWRARDPDRQGGAAP